MTHRVQDWISTYVDSLLGERRSSAIAGEATSDEEAVLAKAARRLKYTAGEDQLQPRPEFVASLEKELRRELAEARPDIRRMPFWRRSWATALGGVAAAAAMIVLFFWARTGSVVPTTPMAAPAAVPRQEAAAPLASPPPKAAGAAPVAPAAAPKPPARTLADVVAEAQVIVLGQVAEVTAPARPAPGEASPASPGVQVVVSAERFLKGPLLDNRVTLRASPGFTFSKGERVLVMARDVNGDGVLDVLDYPQSGSSAKPEGPSATGAADAKKLEMEDRLVLEDLVRQIEGLLAAKP